jgi:tetratricopeptide (TPR) repeat protein
MIRSRYSALCLLGLALSGPLAARPVVTNPAPVSATAVPADPDGLDPQTEAILDACFNDYNSLRFDQAEAEARQAMALQPDLPLPIIYLQATLMTEVQEMATAHANTRAVAKRFYLATKQALALETAWDRVHHGGRSLGYIGVSLGERGMVRLFTGHPLAAYNDGKLANSKLLLARKLDPDLADVDLGLGEYLYYCGRMAGLVRMILVLHGDVPGGIALLQTCGVEGHRCAPLARLELAQILTDESVNYELAYPYVLEAQALYPDNWSYEKLALDEARGLGLDRPEARNLVEAVSTHWDEGWRPPAYAKVDPGPLRLQLAGIYLREGLTVDALRHLEALAKTKGKIGDEARRMEAGVKPKSEFSINAR